MEEPRSLGYIVAVCLIVLISGVQYFQARQRDVKAPVVGSSGFFSSYVAAFRWIFQAKSILQEGYLKHKNGIFKVSQLDRWLVIISGPKLIDEVRRAPDDKLSLDAAVGVFFASEYTQGKQLVDNNYHVSVIRTQLTRNLAAVFSDVRDEIVQSFLELIPPTDEWVGYPALDTLTTIVTRTSNRIFVGLPACRDPGYIKLNKEYTVEVVKAAGLITLAPSFLRPLVGRLLSPIRSGVRRGLKHLRPIIEERLRKYEELGPNYPDKPNDMLTWLMDEAEGDERGVEILCLRLLAVNITAIHTTSMSFAHTMFHLASKPEYIQPMREEVERVIDEDGWTKVAMTKMRKVDSFLKETQRFTGLGFLNTMRLAVEDYTFSDGTYIPKGTLMSVASAATHHDPSVYENANEFHGFRFADLREEDGEGTKHQMVSTSSEYLAFGHGRHACPGRFFAANELKAMMAHIVLNYDVKMEVDGVRPQDMHFSFNCVPNPKATILFRKRRG
ncbi:cytochrome P450 [Rickenella mellea]|uniref:Cytochrome P450 n=1 Tax=Rickenella mellea TaxID=50990 RepID=A0A4Y7Q7L1_9AGAM|nr:cytochrome P450 [Rickenella mellea]